MSDYINYDNELKKLTVLYVEDNPDERKLVTDIIRRRVHRVIEATNGSEALLLVKREQPDIIISDVMMPVMTGIELLKEVKQCYPEIEVILASAYDKRSYFIDAINAGASQFLLKPFAQNRLLEGLYSCVKKIVMERNFHRQQVYVQTILDFQENIVIVVSGSEIIAANKSFLDFFGFSSLKDFKLSKTQINDYFKDTKSRRPLGEAWIKNLLGEHHYMEVSAMGKEQEEEIFLIKASEFPAHKNTFIISFTDVTELVKEHDDLKWQVSIDPLTQIHNRNTFGKILEAELRGVEKYRNGIALILISIKDLTRINESIGIKKADALLVEVSEVIKSKVLYKDVLSRWFGAQFVVMTFGRDEKVMQKLADNLKETLENHRYKHVEHIEVDMDVLLQKDPNSFDSVMLDIERRFETIHHR